MSNLKFVCPFHSCFLTLGECCSKCGYQTKSTSGNNITFRRSGDSEGIYKSYENAYEDLAEDDLSNPIYAEEYQSDLAVETHREIGSVNGLNVAELGVGQGFLQKAFLSETPKSLLALDIAEEYIENAKKIFQTSGNSSTSFYTSVGNVEFMPFHESFDLVVATDILEHVLNLGNALVRIASSLKTGGKFACRVPYKEALGQYSIYNKQKYEFAHLRFFNESMLKTQLKEVGLKPVQVYRNGFQPGRFRKVVPSFFGKNMARLFSLAGHYGNNWYDFNRKSRTFPLRILRSIHQPLELLVISQKV
ncbi:MAG: class I SAM-dependent methyltransferase [Opitutales bacterium]|nr:class I SAM-dependent methyltransferase [Opitutales bacterium]